MPIRPPEPTPHRTHGPSLSTSTLLAVLALLGLTAALAPARAAGCDPPAAPAPERTLRAAFLVVDGVYNSELMAPYDVLQHTTYHADPPIEVFTVSPDGEPITTFEGLTLLPHHSFDDAPPIDILVVPSAEGSMGADLENERMIRWVRETGKSARFVVSLCEGAFVLAEAGLLDGRSATTFPADYRAFSARYPGVDLKVNVSFVHDGPVLTSEGGSRSYDVAMYLVDLLYDDRVATGIGRGLLIQWPADPDRTPSMVVEPADHHRRDPDPTTEAAEPDR